MHVSTLEARSRNLLREVRLGGDPSNSRLRRRIPNVLVFALIGIAYERLDNCTIVALETAWRWGLQSLEAGLHEPANLQC